MKKSIWAVVLVFVVISGFGLLSSADNCWAGQVTITDHQRELAGLSGRAYPGYFDAVSGLLTLFTVASVDFDDYTEDYDMIWYWGGSPDKYFENIFSQSGCDAVLFQNVNTGKYVLAFRGTTAQISDLTEDFALLFNAPTLRQITDAMGIVDDVIDEYGDNLEFTGHSLGGALAMAMGLRYGLLATCFNAVGLSDSTLNTIGVTKSEAKSTHNVVNINVTKDPMTDYFMGKTPYSFFDVVPRYGDNYWLPAKYTLLISRLRNHFYNVIINQMESYNTMEIGSRIN